MSEQPMRPVPALTPENEFFWTSGSDGELRFQRCQDCATYLHPPLPVCSNCLSKNIEAEAVSGKAKVAAFTINYQQWHPAFQPPYIVAIVEIDEAPYVRLTTNIINCDLDKVEIGMPVRVVFEHVNDVWLPLFEPVNTE